MLPQLARAPAMCQALDPGTPAMVVAEPAAPRLREASWVWQEGGHRPGPPQAQRQLSGQGPHRQPMLPRCWARTWAQALSCRADVPGLVPALLPIRGGLMMAPATTLGWHGQPDELKGPQK